MFDGFFIPVVKCSLSHRATLCCSWPDHFKAWAPPVLQSQVLSSFSGTFSANSVCLAAHLSGSEHIYFTDFYMFIA